MAFNPAPTSIWPSYTSDGTNITIPIAALDGLTAAEAHATTGDWRSIMLALCSTAYRHYSDLLAADRPAMFSASMPTISPVTSGTLAGTFRTTYAFVFNNEYCVPDVADEPV
jgi:hypothetical protein